MDVVLFRECFHFPGVFEVHCEWLFHHDVNGVGSGGAHDIQVGVDRTEGGDRIRRGVGNHGFHRRMNQRDIKSVLFAELFREFQVGFDNGDDFEVLVCLLAVEYLMGVGVAEARDGDPEFPGERNGGSEC